MAQTQSECSVDRLHSELGYFQGLSCTYLVLGIVVELLHDAVGGVSFYGSAALVKDEQI